MFLLMTLFRAAYTKQSYRYNYKCCIRSICTCIKYAWKKYM